MLRERMERAQRKLKKNMKNVSVLFKRGSFGSDVGFFDYFLLN